MDFIAELFIAVFSLLWIVIVEIAMCLIPIVLICLFCQIIIWMIETVKERIKWHK